MPPNKQPNSKMCFVCGVENPVGLHLHFYETEAGVVESKYVSPEHFQGYPGVLHGGIVSALIDEVAGRSLMGPDSTAPRFMFTARLEIKYRKNVPIGETLRLVGKAGRSRGKSAEAWGAIYLARDGELLAEGKALLIDVPASQLELTRLADLGWQVVPD
ncbi:MAG TPA: PaaI family thioesterase [Anaerolineales bacterium]|nr:PaaI family thioesterase [Anaerolineales bacterium]